MQYLKNLVPAAGIANSHFDQVKKSDLYKQYRFYNIFKYVKEITKSMITG